MEFIPPLDIFSENERVNSLGSDGLPSSSSEYRSSSLSMTDRTNK
jgi:hypothetical protein